MHQLTPQVKLLHKVVLLHKNKFLILKRASDSKSRPNMWDLPGGNSEWPEGLNHNTSNLHTFDVAREIWEETGLRFRPNIFVKEALTYFSTFFEAKEGIYTVICGWRVKDITDSLAESVTISDEHSEFAWISQEEIGKHDFGGERGEFVVEIIKNGLKNVSKSSNQKPSRTD